MINIGLEETMNIIKSEAPVGAEMLLKEKMAFIQSLRKLLKKK
jgi:hypothetical protein